MTDRPPPPTSAPPRSTRWWPAVLVAAVALVFGRAATFEFISFDDQANVVENRLLQPLTPASLGKIWSDAYEGLYIPATYTAWGLLATVAHVPAAPGQPGPTLNPYVFHLAGIAFHAANAVLVWRILRRVTGVDVPSLIGALLFAVHPLQAEPVAWASGFKDTFAGFWSLLAVLLFLRHTAGAYAAATAAFVVALSAKPAAAVVPAVAALFTWAAGRPFARASLGVLGGWVAIAVPYLLVTRHLQAEAALMTWNPPAVRPLVAADALATYARQLVWPATLAVDYGRTPRWVAAHWRPAAMGIAAAAAAVAGLLWLGRRRRWVAAGVGVFAAGVAPVAGLVPFTYQQFSTVSDRYAYLSMAGAALVLTWAVTAGGRRAAGVAVVALVALGLRAAVRVGDWQDTRALFTANLAVNPTSAISYGNLGTAASWANDLDGAERWYGRASELDPAEPRYHLNLSRTLSRQGRRPTGRRSTPGS